MEVPLECIGLFASLSVCLSISLFSISSKFKSHWIFHLTILYVRVYIPIYTCALLAESENSVSSGLISPDFAIFFLLVNMQNTNVIVAWVLMGLNNTWVTTYILCRSYSDQGYGYGAGGGAYNRNGISGVAVIFTGSGVH